MSVKMLVGAPAYNKAPAPAKIPSPKLYPTMMVIEEDQPVWVSVPQPDKLHLNIRLSPSHFVSGYKPNDPHDYGRMIMQSLATGLAGKVTGAQYVEHAYLFKALQVDLADLGEPVYFSLARTKNDKDGPHTLSIQLNPRLLGEQGAYELLSQLYHITGKRLLVGRMLADARLSRLDVAVDIIGVQIADMLLSMKGAGTQSIWKPVGGDLESVALFRAAKKKTGGVRIGERIAIAYDKRAERLAAGAPPPYGPAPVSRVEITKTRFGNKPFWLTDLPAAPNPFQAVRAGLVRSAQSPISRAFIEYAALRRTYSQYRTTQIMSLSDTGAQLLEQCLQNHPSDLIDGANVWSGWQAGLCETGTALLIEAAVKGSAQVPIPDFG